MVPVKSLFHLPNFRHWTDVLNFSLWSPFSIGFQGTECNQAPYFSIWGWSSLVWILPHSMDLLSLKIGSANTLDISHEFAVWPFPYFVTSILNAKITSWTKIIPLLLWTQRKLSKQQKRKDFRFSSLLLISFFLPLSSISQSFLNLKHMCPKYNFMAMHLVLTFVFVCFFFSFVFKSVEFSFIICII